MKSLILMLLVAASVQSQSLADIARKERERQANLRPSHVLTSTQSPNEVPKPPAAEPGAPADAQGAPPGPAKEVPPSKDSPKAEPLKPQAPPPVDPVKLWNDQFDQLRAKVRGLQDQELALLLQQNQANNQVYATVTDPATQQRALAQVAEIQQKLADLQKDLDETKKTLDTMQLQGPPKK